MGDGKRRNVKVIKVAIAERLIEAAREPAITRRSHLVIAILLVIFLLKKSNIKKCV